jgi:hypothetical protein
MEATSRHDVGFAAENAGGAFLRVHEFKEAELSSLLVEKEIVFGIVPRLVPRR